MPCCRLLSPYHRNVVELAASGKSHKTELLRASAP
jgi:hypothetical protein